MKKRLFVCLAVFGCLLLSGLSIPTTAMAKKPIVLRLVIATPEGDWPQTYRDKELAKRFNKRANGEYRIDVHAGGALAKLPEYFDAVRIGVVEMQFSNWGMFSFLDPRLGLLEIPFLLESNAATGEASKHLLTLYDDILQTKFNAKGLGMTNTGGLGMWSRQPIRSLSDLNGILTASVSPVTSVLIKDLGASPVTMPFPDIYESLQKKIVDAASMSAHGGVVFAYYEVCKNFTAFYGVAALAGWTINLDVWKKMPRHIQTILLEEVQRSADWMNNVVETELPDSDLKVFQEKGVNIYYLPKSERDKWATKFKPYIEGELNKYPELGRKLKKIADGANRKYPYTADKKNM